MATMDGWWDGRAPAGRPDPARRASSPGSEPGAATRPADDGDLEADDAARLAAAPSTPRRPGARSSSSRERGRSSPRPTAPRRSRRSRTRRSRRAGPATCWPGRSARCWPRASSRSRRRGSASTSTAWRATPGRERFGDAGLLASDLPEGLARRAQAARGRRGAADRHASAWGSRRARRRRCHRHRAAPRRRPGRSSLSRSPPPMTRAQPRPADRATAGRAAGLPPLPRTAWLEIDLDALRGNLAVAARAGRTGRRRSGRSSRPTPTGTGRCRSPSRSRRPVPTASASRPSTRRSSCARAAFAAPILVLYPVPAAWAADAARLGIAIDGRGRGGRWRRSCAAAGRARPGDGRSRIELEVETGLGRGGFAEPTLVAAARLVADGAGVDLPACGRISRRSRTPRSRPPRSPGSRRPSRPSRRPGSSCRPATRPRAPAC